VRQLIPQFLESIDPIATYGRPIRNDDGRPSVRLNMITSVDGATTSGGKSGPLGSAADKAIFFALRSLADVILVGAGTVRTEKYGPARLDEGARGRRETAGLSAVPPIAVITRSCVLDWESPFFTKAEARPIVVTASSAPAANREEAAAVADVVIAGDEEVDPVRAIIALGDRTFENVLVEGGPSFNGRLAAADLLDELCLTLAPMLVGEGSSRLLGRAVLSDPIKLSLAHVLEDDDYLFLHYRRI